MQKPHSVTQIRADIFRLTNEKDFLGAYNHLLTNGLSAVSEPGLWGLLARRCDEMGANLLALELHNALWDAGYHTSDAALKLAEKAIGEDDHTRAQSLIETAFGSEPHDKQAQLLLARALADRDPNRAYAQIADDAPANSDTLIFAIDLLRSAGRLKEALSRAVEAKERFPSDTRFVVREARILEALSQWTDALLVWRNIAGTSGSLADTSLYNQTRILTRLEMHAEASQTAIRFLQNDPQLSDQLALAALLEQPLLILNLLHSGYLNWQRDKARSTDWNQIARILLDHGLIGALIWLHGRGAPFKEETIQTVSGALDEQEMNRISALHFAQAFEARSPDIFLKRLVGDTGAGGAVSDTRGEDRRILVINATLAAGGAERQLIALAEGLVEAGFRPDCIHFGFFSLNEDRRHHHFRQELEALGVSIHEFGAVEPESAGFSAQHIAISKALPTPLRDDIIGVSALVKKIRPHVLHGWQDRSALAVGWVGLTQGVERVVLSARNMQPQKSGRLQRYAAACLQEYCQHPNVTLTANSDAGAADYAEWLSLAPTKVKTLRNGISAQRYQAVRRTAQQAPRAITVGGVFRLASNKRPALWIHTMAQLQRTSNIPLQARLVGRGPLRKEIEVLAKEVGLSELHVAQDMNTPEDIYGGIDVLLLMSRIEGLPNVVIEAQAAGIPVAACDVGGVREAMLTEGPGAGLLLDPDIDPETAAQQISEWLPAAIDDGPKNQARREYVERLFSISALGRRISELYSLPAKGSLQ